MKKNASIQLLSFVIIISFLSVFPLTFIFIQIPLVQASNFPGSQSEVNSLKYTTNSRYIYNDLEKITSFDRSLSIHRTFPSNGSINITESWKTNNSYYYYADNKNYSYTISEADNSKADLGDLPSFLAGVWIQRFPNNGTTQNVTLDELSIITQVQVNGSQRITGKTKTYETSLGQIMAYEVEIKGTFEQNCPTCGTFVDIYDSTLEGLFYYEQTTGVLLEYSLECHQLRREDGRTTKDYSINSVLVKINGFETGLSLTPFAPNNKLTTQQIIVYSLTGIFGVLVIVVIVAMIKTPREQELRSEQDPTSN